VLLKVKIGNFDEKDGIKLEIILVVADWKRKRETPPLHVLDSICDDSFMRC